MIDLNRITEEKITLMEHNEKMQAQKYNKYLGQYISRIDEWILQKNVNELINIGNDNEFKDIYEYTTQGEVILLASAIVQLEVKNHCKDSILDCAQSVEDINMLFQRFRFLLWRMENNLTNNAEEELLAYAIENKLSVWAIRFLLKRSSFKRTDSLLVFAMFYIEHQKYIESYLCLIDANEILPNNELIETAMQKVYEKIKENEE